MKKISLLKKSTEKTKCLIIQIQQPHNYFVLKNTQPLQFAIILSIYTLPKTIPTANVLHN